MSAWNADTARTDVVVFSSRAFFVNVEFLLALRTRFTFAIFEETRIFIIGMTRCAEIDGVSAGETRLLANQLYAFILRLGAVLLQYKRGIVTLVQAF